MTRLRLTSEVPNASPEVRALSGWEGHIDIGLQHAALLPIGGCRETAVTQESGPQSLNYASGHSSHQSTLGLRGHKDGIN